MILEPFYNHIDFTTRQNPDGILLTKKEVHDSSIEA